LLCLRVCLRHSNSRTREQLPGPGAYESSVNTIARRAGAPRHQKPREFRVSTSSSFMQDSEKLRLLNAKVEVIRQHMTPVGPKGGNGVWRGGYGVVGEEEGGGRRLVSTNGRATFHALAQLGCGCRPPRARRSARHRVARQRLAGVFVPLPQLQLAGRFWGGPSPATWRPVVRWASSSWLGPCVRDRALVAHVACRRVARNLLPCAALSAAVHRDAAPAMWSEGRRRRCAGPTSRAQASCDPLGAAVARSTYPKAER